MRCLDGTLWEPVLSGRASFLPGNRVALSPAAAALSGDRAALMELPSPSAACRLHRTHGEADRRQGAPQCLLVEDTFFFRVASIS